MLQGQDVAKLLYAGWAPVAVIVGLSAAVRHHDAHVARGRGSQSRPTRPAPRKAPTGRAPTMMRTPMRSFDDEGNSGGRRRWDLNPRTLAGHTISNRADSAALALLRAGAVGAGGASGYLVGSALPGAAAGFCATGDREPSQGRKAAALSGLAGVPQATWLLRSVAPPLARRGVRGTASSEIVRRRSPAPEPARARRPLPGRRCTGIPPG